jgi:hypothetical protein
VVLCLVQTHSALFPWGDHAIVEGETMRAWAGEQLLGTYSRYGWNHPGPALFYWMAPWHSLFGRSPAALNASVAFLNALSLAAIVAVVGRRAGRTAAFGAAAVMSLYVAQQGPELMRDFWIPHAVVLPFATLIVVTAAAAAGSLWLVPLVALVASYLAETDLSVAPASLAVLVAGAAFFVAARGWRGLRRDRRLLAMVAVTVLVCAVVWYPPLYEQLRSGPGNAKAVMNFFLHPDLAKDPDLGKSLGQGISAVANAGSVLVAGKRDAVDTAHASAWKELFLLVTLAALAAGTVVAWQRNRRFASALCLCALTALVGEIYAVTHIRGELYTYLVDWSGAAAAVGWIGVLCAFTPERLLDPGVAGAGRAAVTAGAALAAAVIVWNVVAQVRTADLASHDPAYSWRPQKAIDLAVRRWAATSGKQRPTIYIPQNDAWSAAAGVYIDRLRHGQAVTIDPGWLGVFGTKFAPGSSADSALVFTLSAQPQPTLLRGAYKLVEAGGVIVNASPPPPVK